MRIFIVGAFYTYWGNWHPSDMDNPDSPNQVAGGETAMVKTAEGFARNGCEVYVFYHGQTARYKGVDYLPIGMYEVMATNLEHDLLLSWEEPRVFNIASRSKMRWLAFQCNHSEAGIFDHIIDNYIFVSQWQAASMVSRDRTLDTRKILLCPNGIDLRRYEQAHQPPVPHRIIHSSSPDRGLHHLLRAWPKIREAVPDAELLCVYKMSPWLKIIKERADQGWILNTTDRGMEVARLLEELAGQGVHYLDGTGQWPLARLQMESGAMVYPCDPVAPTEGFSISILEGLAAGIPVVSTDADALGELWGDVTLQLKRPVQPEELADAVVAVLTDDSLRADLIARGKERASLLSWDAVGDTFYNTMMAKLLPEPPRSEEKAVDSESSSGEPQVQLPD